MATKIKLDAFALAYVDAALSSTMDGSDENTGGAPLDRNYGYDDLAEETVTRICNDCRAFADFNRDFWDARDTELVARLFWYARNGHGRTFNDGDFDDQTGQQLQAAAKAFGECNLYVGDDGIIYI